MQAGAAEGERPKLGRKPDPKPTANLRPAASDVDGTLNVNNTPVDMQRPLSVPAEVIREREVEEVEHGEIQTSRPVRSTRNPNPRYVHGVSMDEFLALIDDDRTSGSGQK